MSKPAFAREVMVESPTIDQDGLRVDHPRLREYMKNGFKLGWGNEQICKVTGLPASVVSNARHKYNSERTR